MVLAFGHVAARPEVGQDRSAEIGKIQEVEHVVGAGPYDGFHAVYKDGGVRYLNVQVFPGRRTDWPVPVGSGARRTSPG